MSPVALAVKLQSIVDDIDRGMFMSEIAAKHNVTHYLVRELAFGSDNCRICDKCSGSGTLEGKSGETACDKCKGEGYTYP